MRYLRGRNALRANQAVYGRGISETSSSHETGIAYEFLAMVDASGGKTLSEEFSPYSQEDGMAMVTESSAPLPSSDE
eukprot:CAMPEP_0184687450 /NCGR_PEP_ID=MMETSP0312-20130426/26408_1 /TAXON_ID=31354 /ORGANISM="Compsopogon coeruleus, Strain SAG 36.94" /LENGTH=76 /DNA_ID=CAMNT_0027143603 /DNA_START=296 /DNA_END=526 /DNA_ORIENTATION=-